MTAPRAVDPLELQTFWSRLLSIVDQQAAALIRTSFTPAVSECGDLSACVFDARGYMLAQAVTGTPGHINSMARCVMKLLEAFPPGSLDPGDVIVTNDPWLTSGHHYDITVVTPAFRNGRLIAFFGSICHTADFGGRPYGPDGVDVYEEGLEIPFLKLFRRGKPNEELFQIIHANVRNPEHVIGDLYAQVSGNAVGADRLAEFLDRAGLDDIDALSDELIARSERGMRDAISIVPDGTYRYATDADGYDEPIHLAIEVQVDGDQMHVDYAGTSPQVPQAINVVMNYTEAYTTFGVKCALAPDIPNNEGSFRPISVVAEPGSILNCLRPAPVAARHLMGHFLPGMVLGALAPVLGERAMAEGSAALWSTNVHGTGLDGNRFSLLSFLTGGTGARAALDGLSATSFPSGVSGMPVEVFETRSPLVIRRRELRPDSGGAGQFRGGLGYRVVYSGTRLERPYRLSPFTDRIHDRAPGLFGGLAGAPGSFGYAQGTPLDGKRTIEAGPHEEISLETPGGGGFGNPRDRDPEAVLNDVRQGFVTRVEAARTYGVAITDQGEIDGGETRRLRAMTSSPDT
jgi:N-methylhydantoinase B